MRDREMLAAKVDSLVKRLSVKSLCDYGCGSGELLRTLRDRFQDELQLTGIDYFSSMCEEHQPKDMQRIELVDRGTAAFDRLSGSPRFDLILSTWALHHYQHPVGELRLLCSMLKPGGLAFFADWSLAHENPAQADASVISFLEEAYSSLTGSYHRHHYTVAEAMDLLKSTDLTILESYEDRFEHTAEERKREFEWKLAQVRRRIESLEHQKPVPVWAGQCRKLLSLEAQFLEERQFEYSRYFVVVGSKRTDHP